MTRRPLITSSANVRLKAVRRLARVRARDTCLVEGSRAVRCALAAGIAFREVYVARELLLGDADESLIAAAERRGAEVVELGAAAFTSIVRTSRADGLLALVERPRTALALLDPPVDALVAVAVGIERPGNLGTIVRTAGALGADALVAADPCTDLFHRDVIKGSLGTVFCLPCATASSETALAWLRERGVRLLAATPSRGTPYRSAVYTGAVAIAVGNERCGLSPSWLHAAETRVAIPMPGRGDSLNVGVAAGVLLAEAAHARSVRLGANLGSAADATQTA